MIHTLAMLSFRNRKIGLRQIQVMSKKLEHI